MVSVIVPNYNYARYLPDRLESILRQTFRDLEIIFLDDASTDNSLEKARKILIRSGLSYTIQPNKTNSGSVFSQWAKGLELARGEYVWFAEADDFCRKDFLERVLYVMEPDSSIVLAYSDSLVVDERNRVIENCSYKDIFARVDPEKWMKDYVNGGYDEIQGALFIRNTIPNASAVVMRTEALRKAGGIYKNFTLCGDWMTYLELLLGGGKIAYIAEELNYNRHHEKRVTVSTHKTSVYFEESRRIASSLLGKLAIPQDSQKKYLENYMAQVSLARGAYRLSREELIDLERLFSVGLLRDSMAKELADLGRDFNSLENSRTMRFRRALPDVLIKKWLRGRVRI